jgi:hypothetical protein
MSKLAILVPTLEDRRKCCDRLTDELCRQTQALGVGEGVVELMKATDNGESTTGAKRNMLVQLAHGLGYEYCAFFDDDDFPGPRYIEHQLNVVKSGKDCGSLWGQIYFEGKKGLPFHHSIEYTDLYTAKDKYCRPINHLNTCLTKLRLDNPFPDKVWGEDSIQALSMVGKIKTQFNVDEVVYHYFCAKDKNSPMTEQIIKTIK